MTTPLKIDFVSDIACPWCAVGLASLEQAMEDRFGRYEGDKLYNIGISVDAFALAPPGVPLVLSPKSALGITVSIWDDAAQKKLNEEGKQIIVMESLSGDTVIGTGYTRTKKQQMDALAYNAAKKIEDWLLENPEWFPTDGVTLPQAEPAVEGAPPAAAATTAAPAAAATTAARPVARPLPPPPPRPSR